MDDEIDAIPGTRVLVEPEDVPAVGHIGLQPLDVAVDRRAAAIRTPPRHREDPAAVLELLEEVHAHEARGAGDQDARTG